MREQKGTLIVYALWYVIVTKVIYRLAHKRKCVFRDVRIKTTLSSIWYGYCRNNGERWGIGKFCRWKRLPKRKKVVYVEQELTVWSVLNSCFRYERLAGGHIRIWRRYSVAKAGSDSDGISSHDSSKNDTDSDYNTESSIISAIPYSRDIW